MNESLINTSICNTSINEHSTHTDTLHHEHIEKSFNLKETTSKNNIQEQHPRRTTQTCLLKEDNSEYSITLQFYLVHLI